MSSREVLERRIDAAADHRERRRSAPLGAGYYTPAIRANAKAIGASMLAAAEIHGVTLVMIDDCDDLAATALDLASSLALRRELAAAADRAAHPCTCGRDAKGGPYPRVHSPTCAYVQPRAAR